MRSLSLIEQIQLIWNFFFQLPWKWWLLFFLGIWCVLAIFSKRFFGKLRVWIFVGVFGLGSLLFGLRYHAALFPLFDFIGTQFALFLSFPNLFLYGLVCLSFLFLFFRQVVLFPKTLKYRLWITICSFVFFLCNCCFLFLIVRGEITYHSPEFYTDEVLLSLLQMSLLVFSLWVVGYVILRVYDWFLALPISRKKVQTVVESLEEKEPLPTISVDQTLVGESQVTGDLYRDLAPVLKDAHDFFGL